MPENRWPQTFNLEQLQRAFETIAERAGLPRPTADRPRCGCPYPCANPVLEPGGACPECAASESCLRGLSRMSAKRQAQ